MLNVLLPALLGIRQQEHGAQTGGSQHQRATRRRDGFMTKQHARDLQECLSFVRETKQIVNSLSPSIESVDFRKSLPLNHVEFEPTFAADVIHRAEGLAVGTPKYSLLARPGWLVFQVPQDGITWRVLDIPFAAVTGKKTWLVPLFADLPQNVAADPNIYGTIGCSVGLTDGGTIDGDNLVNVQVAQWGGYGAHPENIWAIDIQVIVGGVSIYSEPTKIVSGAPPAAIVIVKGEDQWHIEVLTASGHAAHISGEFMCSLEPDRFSVQAYTNPDASHALVRGIQGLYAFDSDELVI